MKVTIIIDKDLPMGLITNTAAVLGLSLGNITDDIVGQDIADADNNIHRGITTKNIPILGSTKEQIKLIRDRLFTDEFSEIIVVDFSNIAQKSFDYENYIKALSHASTKGICYLGCLLYGPEKKVNKLTGNIGLLR